MASNRKTTETKKPVREPDRRAPGYVDGHDPDSEAPRTAVPPASEKRDKGTKPQEEC